MGRLPDERRRRHTAYLLSAQQADGGFAGREGGSDLYYTSFALRSLALLGALEGKPAEAAGDFLRSRLTHGVPVVDFLSLLHGATLLEMSAGIHVMEAAGDDWRESVAAALETFRRADGGYARTEAAQTSSTYHTFLVALSLELIEHPQSDPQRLVEFILGRQREEGGFVEVRPMRHGGTNPTAAAVATLKMSGALDGAHHHDVRRRAIGFLSGVQTDEGGLRANGRIPAADLLSTFTGLVALADCDAAGAIDRGAASQFATALEHPTGGFRAAAWDDERDVEYTFYGLGVLALLANSDG